MYKVFLNYKDLRAYMTFLVDWGLVQELQEVESYRTSAKGRKFLADYKHADQKVVHPKPPVVQMPIFGHQISS